MNSFSKIARAVAKVSMKRDLHAYEASTDFEKIVGEILQSEVGPVEASKEYFKEVKKRVEDELSEDGLEMDFKDPEIYPVIRRNALEVADEEAYIE